MLYHKGRASENRDSNKDPASEASLILAKGKVTGDYILFRNFSKVNSHKSLYSDSLLGAVGNWPRVHSRTGRSPSERS
jgi:hypothetical protein